MARARSAFGSQNRQNMAVSEHFCRMESWKSGTPPAREARLEIKIVKTWQARITFGRYNLEKWRAACARSTFGIQNRQNMAASGHFWKIQLGKMARRLRAKHIWKSKSSKHGSFGTLLEDGSWKNGTPPAREYNLEVKSVKTWRSRSTFGSLTCGGVLSPARRARFRS